MKPIIHTRLLRGSYLLVLLIALVGSGLLAPAAPSLAAQKQQIYLPLIASSAASAASSEALIDTALQRGEIDQESALLYYVFGCFRDARLLQQYRGAGSSSISTILQDAARISTRLKPETREILRSFAVPPSVAGSWEEQQTTSINTSAVPAAIGANRWETTCKTSAHIKVWYHPYKDGDAATARTICEIIDWKITALPAE